MRHSIITIASGGPNYLHSAHYKTLCCGKIRVEAKPLIDRSNAAYTKLRGASSSNKTPLFPRRTNSTDSDILTCE